MFKSLRLLLAVALAGCLAALCGPVTSGEPGQSETDKPSEPQLKITETSRGKITEGAYSGSLVISPDGKRIAWLEKRGEKWLVVVDGVKGKEYDVTDGIAFSPDSRRVAHSATRNGKRFVVVDGTEEKEYDGVGWVVFSPDSKHMAYYAKRGEKWFVVVDGAEGKEYELLERTVFSPDSKRLAYKAKRGDKSFVVVDGAEGKGYDRIGDEPLVFSPDSKRLAYAAQIETERGFKWFVVIDGAEWRGYGLSFMFSPDSRHFAYIAAITPPTNEERGKYVVVVDGVDEKECEYATRLVISPDSKRVAYAAKRGASWRVVMHATAKAEPDKIAKLVEQLGADVFDKREEAHTALIESGECAIDALRAATKSADLEIAERAKQILDVVDRTFDQTGEIVFSPDSKRFAYSAGREGDWQVFVDGVEGKKYWSAMGPIIFSPDSKHFTYVATITPEYMSGADGHAEVALAKRAVVVDAAEGKEYWIIGGCPIFSPNSERLAYVACKGREFHMVVDEREGKEYGSIFPDSLVFGPDSKHFAYFAQMKREKQTKSLVAVDGFEGKEYDGRLAKSRIVFDSPTRLHTLMVRDKEIFLVEIEITE